VKGYEKPGEFRQVLESLNLPPETKQRALVAWLEKQATHAPAVKVENLPSPIVAVGPDGKPQYVQVGTKGTVVPTGLTPPVTPDERRAAREEKKEQTRASALVQQTQSVVNLIDEAIGNTTRRSAGFAGAVLSGVPESKAFELSRQLEAIKANIGFDKLQQMREASPTGGALGQVAVQELNALQASLGSLDQRQSPEQIKTNLEKVKRHYQNWLNTVQKANQSQEVETSVPAMTIQYDAQGRRVK
jgi:hypothetical protein